MRTCADRFLYEVHHVRGGRTKQDMIDKHNLHVSVCVSMFVIWTLGRRCQRRQAVKDGKFDIETFVVPSMCTACNLQTVRQSTRVETHELTEDAIQSIQFLSPRCLIASACGDQSAFRFTVRDSTKGQTNVGMLNRLRTATKNITHVLGCAYLVDVPSVPSCCQSVFL